MKCTRPAAALFTAALFIYGCGESTPQLGKDPIEDIVAAMTRSEKSRFVIGTGMEGLDNGDRAVIGSTKLIVPGAAGTTYPIPRLGIPAIVFSDGPAGVRIDPKREKDDLTYYCTHFPMPTLIGATWSTEIANATGKAIGEEARDYGIDIMLAPALNIQRHPLCGRNYEYYSEDPLISGEIAAAYVCGIQECGVGACVKHLAANNQETNRKASESIVSQRALREIYLRGFETAVRKSAPWCVMSSYNYLNGRYTSESPELLDSLLRKEWGYNGIVVSDWFGGSDAAAQMTAGNNLLQPGYTAEYDRLMEATESCELDEAVMDRNICEVLEMIMRTPRFKGPAHSDRPDLKAHAELVRKTAPEGMVLLKNDNGTLPFAEDIRRIALFGNSAYDLIAGGSGSGDVNRKYMISLPEGFKNAGYLTDTALEAEYTAHINSEKARINKEDKTFHMAAKPLSHELELSRTAISEIAERNDAAVISIGISAGEFADRSTESFYLDSVMEKLLEDVCDIFHAKGKKVTAVLNISGVIETNSWKNLPDAILCAWQSGQEGGNSIADVISGTSYPSGKLPMTFPIDYRDHASDRNFPHDADTGIIFGANRQAHSRENRNIDHTIYEEDIYVGYRYFESFDKKVSYPFGYGLSYTRFDYSAAQIAPDPNGYRLEITITNTGHRPGKEIVQVYLARPQGIESPAKELVAFAKTNELRPGESQTLAIHIDTCNLAIFDESQSAWLTPAGQYTFLIGSSVRDIRSSVHRNIEEKKQPVNDILRPSMPITRLSRRQ
ncbi:MAG: beta-glucosidase [Candidatus Cryptobacteroides sp.]